MPLDKTRLLDFLEIIDSALHEPVTVCAAGGTAMTLLDLKSSTIDIDFTIPTRDKKLFDEALAATPHGFKIDTWSGGLVFCQRLPSDYLSQSVYIATFKHLTLKALHPVDIIVSKIGRMDERDEQDIVACVKGFNITKEQVRRRAACVEYVGNRALYETNLEYALNNYFNES